MAHATPNAADTKRDPQVLVISLSNQTISCEETVTVEWSKEDCMEAACDATVKLECSCSHHTANPTQLPASESAPGQLPTGTTDFTLTHPPGFSQNGVEVKATLTMSGGASHSRSRTVNVLCDMMGAAAQPANDAKEAAAKLSTAEREAADKKAKTNAARSAEPITLDPNIPNPIRLVPRHDAVLLGQFWTRAGDTVSVAVLEVGDTSDRVIAELLATIRPGSAAGVKNWSVRIPAALLPQKCDWPRLTLQLNLRDRGSLVRTRTFLTLVLCDRS